MTSKQLKRAPMSHDHCKIVLSNNATHVQEYGIDKAEMKKQPILINRRGVYMTLKESIDRFDED